MQLASAGADFHYTNKNAHTPNFREYDAIARPFVTHGTPLRAAYFISYSGGAIVFSEFLRRTGHPALGLALQAGQIYENTHGAVFSAEHYEP